MLNFLRKGWRKEALAGLDIPIKDMSFVVVDTELTGLDERKDTIISIGAVRMTGGKIDLGDSYYGVADPGAKFDKGSVLVHGITPSDVAGMPGIGKVLSEFVHFCGPAVVVGHCVDIDLEFINKEMKGAFGVSFDNPALDTFAIHGWLMTRAARKAERSEAPIRPGLYEIAKRYGIPVRGVHNALMDAFITAQVFQRFIPMLEDEDVKGIGDLLKVGDPLKGGDRFGPSGGVWRF